MNKILFMSHCVPPIVRGPSVIINRLFKCFPSNSYTILTSRFTGKKLPLNNDLWLDCKYYYVNIETTTGGYKRTYFNILRKWIEVIAIVIKGLKVISKEGCDKLLVCPTHGNFFLAACLIHMIYRKPLYVYFFDLFARNQQKFGFQVIMRGLTEKVALKSTKCAFVMSERLKDYYQTRYPDLKIKIIRHPIDRRQYLTYDESMNKNASKDSESKKIVFTGMIYEYQIDSIINLTEAVKELNDVEFHIYTERSEQYLESMDVFAKNTVYCGHVTNNQDLVRIQKNADILFLPMSFHGPGTDSDVIKTASPVKISEYLAAETPILVHAPKDSYITWYARKYGFGLIVDNPDVVSLRNAIMKLINDKQLRKELILNAGKVAEIHDVSNVSCIFMKEIGIISAL